MINEFDLTKTEKTVYQLLLQGCNAKEISEKLVVSKATVKTHMNNIFKKTGTHSVQKLLANTIKKLSVKNEFFNIKYERIIKQHEAVIKQNRELQQEIRYLKK